MLNLAGTIIDHFSPIYGTYVWIGLFVLGAILISIAYIKGDKKVTTKSKPHEIYKVKSQNQQGGITTGKIENLILADKESLGIREPDSLYQNGKKAGKVINFIADEKQNTFSIEEIEFDQPIRNMATINQPYEYQNYVIGFQKFNRLTTQAPAGASGVSGIILNKK